MCITFEYFSEEYPFILLNNRDEVINRPTIPLSEYSLEADDQHQHSIKIYCGKDEKYGGTWLGVNELGYYCVILNGYEQHLPSPPPMISTIHNGTGTESGAGSGGGNANDVGGHRSGSSSPMYLSRGSIIMDYLKCCKEYSSPVDYIKSINYELFNSTFRAFILLIGDMKSQQHYYYTSLNNKLEAIHKNQVFGVSNYPLDVPCFKVEHGRTLFQSVLHKNDATLNTLIEILKNQERGPLPTPENENVSSIFVNQYLGKDQEFHATRTSSIVVLDKNLNLKFIEFNHLSHEEKSFEFKIK